MLGQFLIVFRESIEVALILAIILAFLRRTGRLGLTRNVAYGAALAIVSSLFLGAGIWALYGYIPEDAEVLFEWISAWTAAAVLSAVVYWMASKGRRLKAELERRVSAVTRDGATFGLFTLSFIVTLREGVETVLFLTPFLIADLSGTFSGSLLGLGAALIIAFTIFTIGMRINIRKFFYFTSILLVLLAGGLVGYGTHELMEYMESAGVELGWLSEYAYILPIQADNPFHHKNVVGSALAALFGYTAEAEWGRVIAHLGYLAVALPLIIWTYRKKED